MKNIIYILFAAIIMINSCSTRKSSACEFIVNDSIRAVIQQYADEHPQYNTFLLRQSDSEIFRNTYFPRGIIVGPGYPDIVEKSRLYFQIGKVRVYIESYINNILDTKNNEIWENTNPEDTVVINNKPTVYSWHKYIYKAIFIYYEMDKIKVNTRPDTIFLPEQIESTIKFVPIP